MKCIDPRRPWPWARPQVKTIIVDDDPWKWHSKWSCGTVCYHYDKEGRGALHGITPFGWFLVMLGVRWSDLMLRVMWVRDWVLDNVRLAGWRLEARCRATQARHSAAASEWRKGVDLGRR